jgi:thiamine-phosphate pyrophosphorylase
MPLPPLYPIIDFSCFATQPDPVWAIARYAEELMSVGVTLIQLRDKSEPANTRRFLSCARELRRVAMDKATLIINDRIDLCLASDADGVHLGQDDLSPEAARRIFDQIKDGKVRAIGPVFATGSKANPDPVVGLEGVRQARQVTRKPLIAIGGITRLNCAQVKDSGADSVAVISDLLESPGKAVADFLRILE